MLDFNSANFYRPLIIDVNIILFNNGQILCNCSNKCRLTYGHVRVGARRALPRQVHHVWHTAITPVCLCLQAVREMSALPKLTFKHGTPVYLFLSYITYDTRSLGLRDRFYLSPTLLSVMDLSACPTIPLFSQTSRQLLCYLILFLAANTSHDNTTRGHEFKIIPDHSVIDIGKHFIAQRISQVWNELSPKIVNYVIVIVTGIHNFVESLWFKKIYQIWYHMKNLCLACTVPMLLLSGMLIIVSYHVITGFLLCVKHLFVHASGLCV